MTIPPVVYNVSYDNSLGLTERRKPFESFESAKKWADEFIAALGGECELWIYKSDGGQIELLFHHTR